MTALILRRWLHDARGGLLGWSIGLAAVSMLYLSLYGTMDSGLMTEYLDAMPRGLIDSFGLQDLASAAGYAQSTVYGLLGAVLMLIAGTARGAKAIAGDEAGGALELEVSAAADRRQVYVGRALGLTAFVLALGLVVGVVTLLISAPTGLDFTLSQVVGGAAALGMLALLHAVLALAVGAATGRPGLALGTAVTVAVLGYVAENLGPRIAEGIDRFSPFHWAYAAEPLAQGPDWGGLGLLTGLTLVLFLLGLVAFPRRDLGT